MSQQPRVAGSDGLKTVPVLLHRSALYAVGLFFWGGFSLDGVSVCSGVVKLGHVQQGQEEGKKGGSEGRDMWFQYQIYNLQHLLSVAIKMKVAHQQCKA